MNVFGITGIIIVIVLWIWGVIDVLNGDLSGPTRTKWLIIILIMPLVGFFLYYFFRKKSHASLH